MKKFLNGKIMKRFILTSALVLSAGLMLSSCLKDDGYYGDYFYPNALVTAKTSDSGTFYFQLDDRTTLKPDNMVKSPYGDKEVRALVNFSDKGPWSGSEEDGLSFDRSVTINAIDSVRTKDAVVTLGDENDKVYGTAPISIIDNSWTVLEDGYLTLTFCAWWGDPRIYHEINLVTGTDPDNPNLVELRHNPLEDDIYYMGGIQATSLLAKHNCDILIHLNAQISTDIPAYRRIQGFLDLCEERNLNHRVIYKDIGTEYEVMKKNMEAILDEIETEYSGMKKGIFVSNDTNANVLLNLLIRKYGRLPDDYYIVGFDDSPISREAVLPISTVGQQIDKIAYEAVSLLVDQMNERKKRRPAPLKEPVHKVVTPVLLRRETTEH